MDNTEIVNVVPESTLGIENDHIIWIAQQAEKRVAAINSIMNTAIKMTTVKDWVNIGGNPYLMETGASKIARLFGISWQINPPVKEYDKDGGGHYLYRAFGNFSFAGAEITADGLRSTKDEFFIGRAGNPNKPQKKPQDIDERDVMQAAYTNCLNNGIKRILPGLRNISIETLKEAGLDISQIKGYGFNSDAPQEMSEEAKNLKSEIERMLKEMYNERWAAEGLKYFTTFTGKDGNVVQGKTDINKLSEAQTNATYGKVKKHYDTDYKKGANAGAGNGNNAETPSSGEGENPQLSMQ